MVFVRMETCKKYFYIFKTPAICRCSTRKTTRSGESIMKHTKVLVLSNTYRQYKYWLRDNNLNPTLFKWVGRVNAIRGYKNVVYITLPISSDKLKKEFYDIRDYVYVTRMYEEYKFIELQLTTRGTLPQEFKAPFHEFGCYFTNEQGVISFIDTNNK